jgi:hypothetical protein
MTKTQLRCCPHLEHGRVAAFAEGSQRGKLLAVHEELGRREGFCNARGHQPLLERVPPARLLTLRHRSSISRPLDLRLENCFANRIRCAIRRTVRVRYFLCILLMIIECHDGLNRTGQAVRGLGTGDILRREHNIFMSIKFSESYVTNAIASSSQCI